MRQADDGLIGSSSPAVLSRRHRIRCVQHFSCLSFDKYTIYGNQQDYLYSFTTVTRRFVTFWCRNPGAKIGRLTLPVWIADLSQCEYETHSNRYVYNHIVRIISTIHPFFAYRLASRLVSFLIESFRQPNLFSHIVSFRIEQYR